MGDGDENVGKRWQVGKVRFFNEIMRLGAGIRSVLVARLLQCGACRNHFDVQLIVADERHDFALGIKRVFTEHRSRRKVRRVAELRENEINGAPLGRH